MKPLILICGTGRSGTSFFCRTIAEAIGDVDESSFRQVNNEGNNAEDGVFFSIISKAQGHDYGYQWPTGGRVFYCAV